MGEVVQGPFISIHRPEGSSRKPDVASRPMEHARSLLVDESAKRMLERKMLGMQTLNADSLQQEIAWIQSMEDGAVVDYINNPDNRTEIQARSSRAVVLSRWIRGEI